MTNVCPWVIRGLVASMGSLFPVPLAARSVFRSTWLQMAVVLACCLAVYANGLHVGLIADDFWLLHSARGCDVRCALTTSPATWGGFYRPMHVMFYKLGYLATGHNPLSYHVAALALHAGVSLLLYSVLLAVTQSSLAAFLAAILFAVAPFHTNAVTWPAGAEYSLVALWLLLSFLCYVSSRNATRRAPCWRAVSVLAFTGALMSQESAVVLPVLLVVYELLLGRCDLGNWRSWATRLGPYLLLDLVYLWYSRGIVGARGIDFGESPYSYALGLNIIENTAYFGANLFSPVDLYPFLNNLGDVGGAISLAKQVPVALLALAAIPPLSLLALWSYWAARSRPLLFWSVSILLFLSPFLMRVHVGELYLYLPSIGSCAAVATLVALIHDATFPPRAQWLRLAPILAVAAIALIFAVSTIRRNGIYRTVGATGETILRQVRTAHPDVPDAARLYFANQPGTGRGLSVMGLRGVEVFEPYGISPAIKMAYNNDTLRASLVGYDEMVALLARSDCNEGDRLYFIWRDSHLVEASCAAVAQPQQRVSLW